MSECKPDIWKLRIGDRGQGFVGVTADESTVVDSFRLLELEAGTVTWAEAGSERIVDEGEVIYLIPLTAAATSSRMVVLQTRHHCAGSSTESIEVLVAESSDAGDTGTDAMFPEIVASLILAVIAALLTYWLTRHRERKKHKSEWERKLHELYAPDYYQFRSSVEQAQTSEQIHSAWDLLKGKADVSLELEELVMDEASPVLERRSEILALLDNSVFEAPSV